ncbi:hypothetical protein ACFYOV_17400 [Streptomyces sp. NPDC005931]|uniref:hypothetical protein n=1 Tax=Streptomyces sp. NPDC005931 TaxID=3364737 RepID=UPI0036C83311
MTSSLRYAHASSAAALLFTAGAAWLARTPYWPVSLCLLYTAGFFVWLAAREYAHHKRVTAEQDWARRRALGQSPPPLEPCCRLGRTSKGAAHDHKCTDPAHRYDGPRSET